MPRHDQTPPHNGLPRDCCPPPPPPSQHHLTVRLQRPGKQVTPGSGVGTQLLVPAFREDSTRRLKPSCRANEAQANDMSPVVVWFPPQWPANDGGYEG